MHLVITILWTEWTISLHKMVYIVQNILIEAEEYLHTILKCILAGIAVFAEKHNPYTLGRTMLIFVRKSACKMAAVEEGDRTWPEVAPEVPYQKAKN